MPASCMLAFKPDGPPVIDAGITWIFTALAAHRLQITLGAHLIEPHAIPSEAKSARHTGGAFLAGLLVEGYHVHIWPVTVNAQLCLLMRLAGNVGCQVQ